ncbi:MAG TPA: hypothetical protein VF629_20155 [Hymenobacter sp.]|uniref:hypothetical protein n=1 Tax=Hymenobacter sp. TaxID=1898978 RepID=UPI002EDA2F2F
MHTSTTFFRRLLPALLLASLALASCGEDCKEDDPKPSSSKSKQQDRCPTPPAPSGNS